MGQTRASVVLVTYNSAAHVGACLDALLPTLAPGDEVVVFDNDSTDGSADLAAARARTTRSVRNLGFGGGANRGAEMANGRWLVFLNPDTRVEPGWLEALLAPIADSGGVACAKLVLMDEPERVDAIGNTMHLSGITVRRGFRAASSVFSAVERILVASGAALAIDRASFRLLGGFDEHFFMYLEDTDLSLRAALAGLPVFAVGASVVRHDHGPSFGARKLYWLERNRWLMLLKVWSWRTFAALLPVLVLTEIVTWGFALLGGPAALRAKAGAVAWHLRHPWQIRAARRRTQRLRRVDDRELLAYCGWRLEIGEVVGSPLLRRSLELLLMPMFAVAAAFERWVVASGDAS